MQLLDTSQIVGERKTRIRAESRHTPPPSLPRKVKFAGMSFDQFGLVTLPGSGQP
jgi:hypothetical protein